MRILAAWRGWRCVAGRLGTSGPHPHPAQTRRSRSAANRDRRRRSGPDPRVGAVFLGGSDLHTCTARCCIRRPATWSSPPRTAWRGAPTPSSCPASRRKAAPRGRLDGRRASISTRAGSPTRIRWPTSPIARVSRDGGGSIEAQAGGGSDAGQPRRRPAPTSPSPATPSVGGGAGRLPGPHGARRRRLSPSLPCAGLVDGTSGAPWISGSRSPASSAASTAAAARRTCPTRRRSTRTITRLLARAEAGGPGDARAERRSTTEC